MSLSFLIREINLKVHIMKIKINILSDVVIKVMKYQTIINNQYVNEYIQFIKFQYKEYTSMQNHANTKKYVLVLLEELVSAR